MKEKILCVDDDAEIIEFYKDYLHRKFSLDTALSGAEALALVGVKQVMQTVKDIERHLHHSVRISAVLPTFYDVRTKLAREAYLTLRGHFRHKCLEPVRQNTRLAEAPANRKTIFEYAPDSNGAADYRRVVDWLVGESMGLNAPEAVAQ